MSVFFSALYLAFFSLYIFAIGNFICFHCINHYLYKDFISSTALTLEFQAYSPNCAPPTWTFHRLQTELVLPIFPIKDVFFFSIPSLSWWMKFCLLIYYSVFLLLNLSICNPKTLPSWSLPLTMVLLTAGLNKNSRFRIQDLLATTHPPSQSHLFNCPCTKVSYLQQTTTCCILPWANH